MPLEFPGNNITVRKQQFTQKSKLIDGYLLYTYFFQEKEYVQK